MESKRKKNLFLNLLLFPIWGESVRDRESNDSINEKKKKSFRPV